MTSEELTTLNDVFGALNNDSNENANNYDIIIRNQTSGNAMKVPVVTFKTVLYNYLTSASVAASLASVLGGGVIDNWTDPINAPNGLSYSMNIERGAIPSSENTAGWCFKSESGDRRAFLFFVSINRDYFLFRRKFDGQWGNWQKVKTEEVG